MPRGARLCLAMLAIVPGCLTAPPDSVGDDGGQPSADAAKVDGASGCTTIVKDTFLDDALWFTSDTGSGDLALFDDRVEIRIMPTEEPGFVELTTMEDRPIEGTRVEASLVVYRSDAGNVSIAFDGTGAGGGYYEINVSDGVVQSVRADVSIELLCGVDCPAYQQELHQRFRLRARQDQVFYESWDGERWAELVPPQAGSPLDFTVSMKGFGTGEGLIDALLSGLSWQECAE